MSDCDLKAAALRYAEMGLAVHPLQPRGKRPATAHGCKDATTDAEQIEAAWSVKPFNIGIACGAASGGLLVIDIDVDNESGEDGYVTLREWELEHGELPDTATAVTGRGGQHMFYRVSSEVRPSANPSLGVDVRGDGSYVMAAPSVHPNGNVVTWEVPPEEGIAEADGNVLAFVERVRPAADKVDERGWKAPLQLPPKVTKGDRDNTLYKMACSMRSKRMGEGAIMAACLAENTERFEPPLPERDVRRIVKSAMRRPEGTTKEREAGGAVPAPAPAATPAEPAEPVEPSIKPKRFNHADVGDALISDHGACIIDGMPAVANGMHYGTGWQEIDRKIVSLRRDATRQKQTEVHHYLSLMAPRVSQSRPTLVAFANGVLDVETEELMAFSNDMVITNVIPHDWVPGASCPAVDNVLGKIAAGSLETYQSLIEVMGACVYRSNEFGQAPILLGVGSNGKSTYIKMLRALLGPENVTSLDLATLGMNFQQSHLVGKLANLGDDISNEFQGGNTLAIFKKIVTGDRIFSDVKGQSGLEFNPYCTLVFSANDFPRLGDSTDGMMRRLFPIPFRAVFRRTDPDYNPRITEEVTGEAACERMCVLAVAGLQSMIRNNGFTETAASRRQLDDIRMDNDSALLWLDEERIGRDRLAGAVIKGAYEDYSAWAVNGGLKPLNRNNFTKRLNAEFGFESKCVKRDGKAVRVFG